MAATPTPPLQSADLGLSSGVDAMPQATPTVAVRVSGLLCVGDPTPMASSATVAQRTLYPVQVVGWETSAFCSSLMDRALGKRFAIDMVGARQPTNPLGPTLAFETAQLDFELVLRPRERVGCEPKLFACGFFGRTSS